MSGLGKALLYGVVTALCVIAIVLPLSQPSTRERQQTAANVERLVTENELNRELLCLVALRDRNNPAWSNPRIVEICGQVGVMP